MRTESKDDCCELSGPKIPNSTMANLSRDCFFILQFTQTVPCGVAYLVCEIARVIIRQLLRFQ